jgi:L-gulono-1,4-lactone dehydrogenase
MTSVPRTDGKSRTPDENDVDGAAPVWRNWSRTESATPARLVSPTDTQAVVREVRAARERGGTVKMVGSGHSFTGIAVADDAHLRPDALTGILAVDRDAMTVTVAAGTPLHVLNARLADLGLSLHNMGDVDAQTIAGATSTGTHGTGGTVASLAAQVVGLELVTGTGEVLRAGADEHPEVLAVARVGLGALGILTSLTLRIEPLFALEAHERPMGWDEALSSYDELVATHDHVDMYWFPHTDRMMTKTNDRLADLGAIRPLPRWRGWVDDELLANTVFGALTAAANRVPAAIPRLNRFSAVALSERRYSDVAHRVFTSPRTVRFKEMEYAVPRDVGLDVLREVRREIDASDWRVSFPVEIRTAPADDVALSTASGRDSLYLAFHVHASADHRAYFDGVEAVLRSADGRPHWGKMHTRTAADLAPAYPRWTEFVALRDRLDPDRVFTNPYLQRVLG